MKSSGLVRCQLGISLIIAGLCSNVRADSTEPLEAVQKAASDWVKIRAETARAQTDWTTQRELLEASLRALEDRAKNAEGKRDSLKVRTAKDREELGELQARNESVAAALEKTNAQLKTIQDALLRLRPSLPPRLSEALELPYKSLENQDLNPSDRMQYIMTVLNRCVQFNRLISNAQEVLKMPGEETPKMLEVIYWGLSRGYALDRISNRAWVGHPHADGWHWVACPESAQQVAQLLAVYNDKAEPSLVSVPATVEHVAATR